MRFNFAIVSSFLLASTVAARPGLALARSTSTNCPLVQEDAAVLAARFRGSVTSVAANLVVPEFQGEGGLDGLVALYLPGTSQAVLSGFRALLVENGNPEYQTVFVCADENGFDVSVIDVTISPGDMLSISVSMSRGLGSISITNQNTQESASVPASCRPFDAYAAAFGASITTKSPTGQFSETFSNIMFTTPDGEGDLTQADFIDEYNTLSPDGSNTTSITYNESSVTLAGFIA